MKKAWSQQCSQFQLIRLKSAETGRWRTYDLDTELDPTIMQQLNDLAFLYGVEIVSTCAGHDFDSDDDVDENRPFAEIRFSALYPQCLRLEAQRARLAIETVARAIRGRETATEIEHGLVYDPEAPRKRRLEQSFLTAVYTRATAEAPDSANAWWKELVERLRAHAPPVPTKRPRHTARRHTKKPASKQS